MNKEWRPQNPYPKRVYGKRGYSQNSDYSSFEAGASAMLKAVVKYLFEPCTEHPYIGYPTKDIKHYENHRFECYQCMKGLNK